MNYKEVAFTLDTLEPWRDIVIAQLGELGYESFEEDMEGFKAWIPQAEFDESKLVELKTLHAGVCGISWSSKDLQDKNWNAVWEENFTPVLIDDKVFIRAEHHASVEDVDHEIVIQPRMAFGTGHHATTTMMVKACLSNEMLGKSVCDLGCGTAVLAILASRMGGTRVVAIDNDANAVDNAKRNCIRNETPEVHVEIGVIDAVKGHQYDIILANIQRNVLVEGMNTMAEALNVGGLLYLSGFILDDVDAMKESIIANNMQVVEQDSIGEWALLGCRRLK